MTDREKALEAELMRTGIRMRRLAKQIEKLSWMCEYISETGFFLDDAEFEWKAYQQERYESLTPYV